MRLRDRLTGQELEAVPEIVHPGRYFVLQDTTLNGHSSLLAGDLVCSDGGERCHLGGVHVHFATADIALAKRAELLIDAVTTISCLLEDMGKLPSPLFPANLVTAEGQLTPFELELGRILEAGHLHSISSRPRLDLKYEQAVTDVARARRLASNALTHLASHSECWQRQTLSGIVPRRILARFSSDDYSIYENRVYARLLDGLDAYLTNRLFRLEEVRGELEEALKFTAESTVLDYRLTNSICDLWGRTFSTSQTREQLKATRDTLHKLQAMHTLIRGLKQAGLYLMVPRSAQIGGVLHRTNILSHDPHYRHLSILWDQLQCLRKEALHRPNDILVERQHLERQYSAYVGLVLRQAMLFLGLDMSRSRRWAGHDLGIRQTEYNWEVLVDDQVRLTLVPWACMQSLPEDVMSVPSENRLICWPGIEREAALDAATIGHAIQVTPRDLYVVERMASCVTKVLTSLLLSGYGKPLQPLPSPVAVAATGINGFGINGHQGRLWQTPSLDHESRIRDLLQQHARVELVREFEQRLSEVIELNKCPVCGQDARLKPQDGGGFSSECAECGCKRYWRRDVGRRWLYRQLLNETVSFQKNGHRSFEFSLVSGA